MKYLIYELFSGVGLCNQLFSLESAIYFANIMDRKLILIIKNPLCHCGRATWDYGYLLNFFNNDYYRYLPHGIEVYYKTIPNDVNDKIKSAHHFASPRYSHTVFIDKDLNTTENQEHIKDFCHWREPTIFDINEFLPHEYIFMKNSNASRCFYNFYTTRENYELMYDITRSIKFKDTYYEIAQKLYNQLPEKNNNVNIFLHLRFGDYRKEQDFIERANGIIVKNLSEYLQCHQTNMIRPTIYALVDNEKNEKFNNSMKKFNINYINNYTKNVYQNFLRSNEMLFTDLHKITNFDVVNAIIEMLLATMSEEFIGYSSSTFSHYIQFLRYIKHKSYYNYCNLNNKNLTFCRLREVESSDIEWKRLGFSGGHVVSWHYFFKPLYSDRLPIQLSIYGKMDGFGSQVHACFSLIAYCAYKDYEYVHTPFYHMTHNDEKLPEFHNVMNQFINLEHVFKSAKNISNFELSKVHTVKEGYYVHGSLTPEFFYNKDVLEKIRKCYNSTPKPDLSSVFYQNNYNIAIHVRRGDVGLNRHISRYTSNIDYVHYLKTLTFPENAQLHIFSEGKEEDFSEFKAEFPNIRFQLNINIQETFHCLVKADMLVMSKSSFCYAAAILNENKVNGHFIRHWWHKPFKTWLQ